MTRASGLIALTLSAFVYCVRVEQKAYSAGDTRDLSVPSLRLP